MLAAQRNRVWGSCTGIWLLSVQRYDLSPDDRIYTKALIIWFVKAGSILAKLEPAADANTVSSPSIPLYFKESLLLGLRGWGKGGKIGVW